MFDGWLVYFERVQRLFSTMGEAALNLNLLAKKNLRKKEVRM